MNEAAPVSRPSFDAAATDWPRLAALAVGLFVLLFAVYVLAYSGVFHSVDEISRLAVLENLVKNGRFDANSFLAIHFGLWGSIPLESGVLYAKYGLADSVLPMPLYWPALQLGQVGLVQATMLFNALVTPLTAVFILFFATRLGYRPAVGVLTGLAFGVATIAAVYARYFFSEPLAGLTLLATAYFFLCYKDALAGERSGRRRLWATLAGVAFGLALLNRISNVIAAPALLVYPLAVALAHEWRTTRDQRPGWGRFLVTGLRRHWADAVAFLAPCLVLGGLVVAYNLARFGDPLRSGYVGLESRFMLPSLAFAYGLLFSPGKGFFVYSPVLLAALAAAPAFFRRQRAEASVILGVAALHVLFYASYDTWAGRACWGPRHIVPITPFVALLLAPAIAWALRSRIWAAVLLALGAISAGIQVIGSSVDFFAYLAWLGAQGPDVENTLGIYDPAYSPILGNLRFITPATLDYAWAYAGGVAGQIDPAPIVLALALAAAAGVAMWAAGQRRWNGRRVTLLALTGALALGGLVAAVLPRYAADPRLGARADERAAIVYLEEAVQPGDALIVTTTADLGVFWNTNRARVPWYSLYPSIPPDWTNKVDAVLRGATARERRLWLVLDGLAPGDPSSGVERWLAEESYPVRQERVGDLRLCLYVCPAAPLADAPAQPTDARLGDAITLLGYTLGAGPFRPGGEAPLSLYWRAEAPVGADYTVFVQLLGPDGRPVAQIDSYPVAGFRPTGAWVAGEVVRDNYGLAAPADAPAGRYRLIVGMYDLATMQRLPVASGGDFVLLAEFELGK